MKKIVACIDVPPNRIATQCRNSIAAAAQRWGAEMIWIDKPLASVHVFWNKCMVANHIQKLHGPSRVVQMDGDMIVRSDAPCPLDLVPEGKLGHVTHPAGRWTSQANSYWARYMNVPAAPSSYHIQGGLLLYDTPLWINISHQVLDVAKKANWNSKNGADETVLSNLLWSKYRHLITRLPQRFNTLLSVHRQLVQHQLMHSYIYHQHTWREARNKNFDWTRVPVTRNDISPVSELLDKHGSDKNTSHSYGHFYDTQVSPETKRILELGVKDASSIQSWLGHFPDAEVYGVDIRSNGFKHPRYQFIHASATQPEKWIAGLDAFDLIIDDASHIFGDQLISLAKLWSYLKPGGLYVIEDIGAYQQVVPPSLFDCFGGKVLSYKKNGRKDDVLWFRKK